MKNLQVLVLISFLSSCSQTNKFNENIESKKTITSVSNGCSMLGIEMTMWKSANDDGVYRCISNYIDIPPTGGIGKLPNNLAYYAQGTKNTINELKVVLNVNNKNYEKRARDEFIITSSKVYKNIKSHEIPKELIDAIYTKNNYSISDDSFTYSIENDVFEDDKGFTQKFTIRLK
ncbi:MAG: hypothetical protein IE909_10005 [Campylobacterales bacterium]|nr:hypothetical protein [Campylobacterales bacterium]